MAVSDRFRGMITVLDSVINQMTGLGGGSDKGSQVAVDQTVHTFNQTEKDALTRNDGYIVAWFGRLADESTLTGWDLKTGAKYLRQFADDDKRLKIGAVLRDAFKAALRDGGSLLLLVTDDGDTDWSKPLDLKKVKSLQAVHAFDGAEFDAASYDTDIRSTNYRGVDLWQISPQVGGGFEVEARRGTPSASPSEVFTKLRRVHHTRAIYIPGRILGARLRYLMGGKDDPYFIATWDGLKDMRQIDQGGAVLAQEMKESVIQIAGLEGVEASSMAETLMTRLRTIIAGKSLLNAIVLGDGDTYSSRAVSATGFKDLKGGARSTWAACTGQPETVAFGATPGGLNTDGEAGRKAWDRVLAAIQKTHLLGPLERYYGVLIAAQENAGTDVPDDWQVVFRPLGTLTRKEEADTRLQTAMADRIHVQAGILPASFIAESRFGTEGYQYDLPPFEKVSKDEPTDPTRALAGPQGRTLLEYVLQVSTKSIPRETGVALIMHAFQFTKEEAEAIMGDVGQGFFAPKPEEVKSAPDADVPDRQIQGGKKD